MNREQLQALARETVEISQAGRYTVDKQVILFDAARPTGLWTAQDLDRLVREAEGRGVTAVSLEATDMGRPLYEAYGFVAMENEMELPESYFRRDAARETGEE